MSPAIQDLAVVLPENRIDRLQQISPLSGNPGIGRLEGGRFTRNDPEASSLPGVTK